VRPSALLLLLACGPQPPPFEQAAAFVRARSSASYLSTQDPVFLALEGRHGPAEWINYFFPTLSTRNWVTAPETPTIPGAPAKPAGIAIVPLKPRSDPSEPQLVVIPDELNGRIVVEGYGSPPGAPLFWQAWDFPKFK
jgi:hypothetical protein